MFSVKKLMMMYRYLFKRTCKGKAVTPEMGAEAEAIFKDFKHMTPDELMKRIEALEVKHGIKHENTN